MLADIVRWTATVAFGAIYGRDVLRRDIGQACGAFGLLLMSFQCQFGAYISRSIKSTVATFFLLAFVVFWRFTRPPPPKPTVA